MEQTIVGAFDNIYRAQAAKQALLSAGFDDAEINVQANTTKDHYATAAVDRDEEDNSIFESVGEFFADLLGADHDQSHRYADTVRQGGAVVAVTVEEEENERAATAQAALMQSGAVDIEKYGGEWSGKPDYFSGPDEEHYTITERSQSDSTDENTSALLRPAPDSVVAVERDGGPAWRGSDTLELGYRRHYASTYAGGGKVFEDYAAAYRYGSSLASDQRYRDSDWDDIETQARPDWDDRHPDTAWDRVKAAVRHGWEAITGRDQH